MKKTDFNELIEKAFSLGYEYGQKEFGQVKRENKRKKNYQLLNSVKDCFTEPEDFVNYLKTSDRFRILKLKNPKINDSSDSIKKHIARSIQNNSLSAVEDFRNFPKGKRPLINTKAGTFLKLQEEKRKSPKRWTLNGGAEYFGKGISGFKKLKAED